MDARFKNRYFLPVLAAALGLIPAGRASAQAFTTLYDFTNGSDGAVSQAGLSLSGDALYGTTEAAGDFGGGTVFKVNTDGTGFATVHSFVNGTDGSWPWAGLILWGNTLFGTANYGGSSGDGTLFSGNGTVFKVNTDGTGFATLYNFTNGSDGALPEAGLILSGNALYGTASAGGTRGNGTVFAVNIDGTGFRTLHSFSGVSGNNQVNSDGARPYAGLILSGNTSPYSELSLSGNALYGTACYGGTSGDGTVFQVNTDGTGFVTLHSFISASDGANPQAGLILSSNALYGTAWGGGTSGSGTVFKVNTDGTGFAILHNFISRSDGANPQAGLILSGNTLYGTGSSGGTWGNGTVFQVNTDGTGFETLYSFTARTGSSPPFGFGTNSDGANPDAGLILSGNTLYGTASDGGTLDWGTVFSLSLPLPQLAISQSGTNVVLSWPTNFTGITLQSTTNLVSPAVWIPVFPAPVVVSGQNTVTNPISGTQQFYRLSQ
jgi:uncharacterized repeat protein (TIGR03803 family)